MSRAHSHARHSLLIPGVIALFLVGCAKDPAGREPNEPVVDRGTRPFAVVESLHLGDREHDLVFGSYAENGVAFFDRLSGRLLVASRGSDTLRTIGRTGSGPGEYRSVVDGLRLADEVLVLDALRRIVITYDTGGALRETRRVEGGARKLLARSGTTTLVSGRFMRTDRPDTVDAVLRLDHAGEATRHVPLPFPTDPTGRRFSDVYVAACGIGQFAAARADTNVVWIVDASTLAIVRTLSVSVAFVGARMTPSPESTPDSKRFRFTGMLGDETGCVIISPQDVDGDAPRLDLYRIGTRQSGVDLFTVPLRLPVAFRRDTLFALDENTDPQMIRILAAELK
jgi:hypothetical protein